MTTRTSSGLAPILLGGLIAGTFDITYACIFSYVRRGTRPAVILQSVASGVFGQSAFTGGLKMAAMGLLFHFLIATIAAAVYYLASRKIRILITQAVVCGILFGVCVYLVMNLVVVPLSAAGGRPSFPWPILINGLLIHMLGVGLPSSLFARAVS